MTSKAFQDQSGMVGIAHGKSFWEEFVLLTIYLNHTISCDILWSGQTSLVFTSMGSDQVAWIQT